MPFCATSWHQISRDFLPGAGIWAWTPQPALLNDLYQGIELEAQRQQQLISLFKLRFDNPQDMRADVQGKPVYLGLAMNEQGLLKLKPQNLLLNLPLAGAV